MDPRVRRSAPALLGAALTGTLLTGLVGCAGSGAEPSAGPSPPDASSPAASSPSGAATPTRTPSPGDAAGPRYVALGDSYTAGPFVPRTDMSDGCFRSDGNYPSLLAGRLDLDLVDVSCGGATTEHLTAAQRTPQETRRPPQLSALDRRTDLVTLGIGGNDFGLFADLLQTCLNARRADPGGAPCGEELAARSTNPQQLAARVGDRVEESLALVQRAAPRARVVLVGYPRIAPTSGSCPRRLPFAAGDIGVARAVERSLDRALRDAARDAGTDYLDARAASRGHDVCSEQPWVNGSTTRIAEAAAFHPFARGMSGLAEALERQLASSTPGLAASHQEPNSTDDR